MFSGGGQRGRLGVMFTLEQMDSAGWLAVVAVVLGLPAGALGVRWGLPRLVLPAVVGLLLGPAVLGEAWSEGHRALMTGGCSEHRVYESRRAALEDELASFADDITPEGADEARAMMAAELEPLREAVDTAEADRADQRRTLTWVFVCAALACCGALAGWSNIRATMTEAALLGLFMLLGAGLAAFAGAWVLDRLAVVPDVADRLPGLVLGCAAVATPIGARLLATFGKDELADVIDDRPALVQGAAVMLSMIVFVGLAMTTPPPPESAADTVANVQHLDLVAALATGGLVVVAIIVGFMLHDWRPATGADPPGLTAQVVMAVLLGGVAILSGVHPAAAAWVVGLTLFVAEPGGLVERLERLVTPVAALLVATRVELSQFNVWLLLAALIAFGDGKALGMAMSARLFGGRGWASALRMGATVAAGGIVPLAVALVLLEADLIAQPVFGALVLTTIIAAAMARPIMAMVMKLEPAG